MFGTAQWFYRGGHIGYILQGMCREYMYYRVYIEIAFSHCIRSACFNTRYARPRLSMWVIILFTPKRRDVDASADANAKAGRGSATHDQIQIQRHKQSEECPRTPRDRNKREREKEK